MRLRTPRLDFLVIGAQKAGTTSLWRYLEDNAGLRMPPDKEASFFTEPGYPADLRAYLRALFRDAPRGARLGTVTPVYMHGVPGVPVPEIVRRIRATAPAVRLVALLRDPVARARSAHQMMAHRGEDGRSFADAVADQLEPAALELARREPSACNSYVAAGEYGRILGAYLEEFPREQLHVELSADLERDPTAVVERVCAFLGVAPHVPRHVGTRFHVGGPLRVPQEAADDLKGYLERNVWPRVRHAAQHRDSFDRFFEFWNVAPAPAERPVDEAIAAPLRAHFAHDAVRLHAATGLALPWL